MGGERRGGERGCESGQNEECLPPVLVYPAYKTEAELNLLCAQDEAEEWRKGGKREQDERGKRREEER